MECSICLEELNENTTTLKNCDHTFHTNCVNSWLKIKPSCPLCRTPTLSKFRGRQHFGKNNFLNCFISFKNDEVLEIKYNNIYNAQLNINRIKHIFTDKKITIIKFLYNDKFINLKFNIEQAFLFAEYFKNYVSKLRRLQLHN